MIKLFFPQSLFRSLLKLSGFLHLYYEINAYTDSASYNKICAFNIPENMLASNFDFMIIPSWHRSNMPLSNEFNIVELRKKGNCKSIYHYILFRNGAIRENLNLHKLILPAGDYELIISANPGNEVILKYDITADLIFSGERMN